MMYGREDINEGDTLVFWHRPTNKLTLNSGLMKSHLGGSANFKRELEKGELYIIPCVTPNKVK